MGNYNIIQQTLWLGNTRIRSFYPTQRTGLVIRLNSNLEKPPKPPMVVILPQVAKANGNVGVEVVKYNVGGGVKWVRHYGSAPRRLHFDMIPTADGGYISCGRAVRTPAATFRTY